MIWELKQVKDIDWKQDDSGYYALINYVNGEVRLDIMTNSDMPCISFQGTAKAVRKNALRYCDDNGIMLSAEHSSYIGYELLRAEIEKENYTQD